MTAAARTPWWRRLRRCRKGSIPVEMALVTPVLLTMLLGVVDLGWYIVMQHKMARVAATLADLTSRGETISEAQMRDIFAAARNVAAPFDIDTEGRAIVSSITNPAGAGARIVWQRLSPHGLDIDSRIGSTGEVPVMPEGFVVGDDENIIAAEAFYAFQPVVGLVLRGQQDIYVRAVQRPRLGTLDQVAP